MHCRRLRAGLGLMKTHQMVRAYSSCFPLLRVHVSEVVLKCHCGNSPGAKPGSHSRIHIKRTHGSKNMCQRRQRCLGLLDHFFRRSSGEHLSSTKRAMPHHSQQNLLKYAAKRRERRRLGGKALFGA